MTYQALASDYDGTLASNGVVAPHTVQALHRLKNSGRKLLLVTGRNLEELLPIFPEAGLCDRIVAENGAVLHCPESGQTRLLSPPPPERFAQTLLARGVRPLSVGRVIVATWEPHQHTVLEVIRQLGLELQVIFNKGAVMVLPSTVNKATGLQAALKDLGLAPAEVVGVGDAENDHAFLALCGCAVTVANALPALKERAGWVTPSPAGAGVVELIEKFFPA